MNPMRHFRVRTQKSGRTFYYFDKGGKPRKEIPLGPDYVMAVRKWSELMAEDALADVSTFEQLAARYELEVIPLKAKSTQATQRGDMKKLREFFTDKGTAESAPLAEITPKHIRALLDRNKATPTTANRLKRLFSHMFNKAREWDYTERANPVTGVRGFELDKREVYVTDEVFRLVRNQGEAPLQDAMDLAYLTGQRPSDVLKLTERDVVDGMLAVKQGKTKAKRRIRIEGELAVLMARITARKAGYKVWSANLAVNTRGLALTKQTLRTAFEAARDAAAIANPKLAEEIRAMWFYDLRAKAADDVSDDHGDQAAADLLGHGNVATTKKHYLRKGKIVPPTR
jgi:integrase